MTNNQDPYDLRHEPYPLWIERLKGIVPPDVFEEVMETPPTVSDPLYSAQSAQWEICRQASILMGFREEES